MQDQINSAVNKIGEIFLATVGVGSGIVSQLEMVEQVGRIILLGVSIASFSLAIILQSKKLRNKIKEESDCE